MKKFITLLTVISIAGIIACGSDDNGTELQEPKEQSEVISGLFDNNATATVEGLFTDAEWTGVAEKIKAALNKMFDEAGEGMRNNVIKAVFNHVGGVTIVLEKEPAYDNYRATLGVAGVANDKMYINFAILNDEEALGTALENAIRVMAGFTATPETGKKGL